MRSASSRSTELTLARLGPAAAALLHVVQRVGRGEGTVLVGGAVRDALLGRPVADLDVAVPAGALALAERVATALGATAVVLDAERGAARVAGPGLQLDFSDFRAPDLAGDLAARDFTVNALGVPLAALLAAGRAGIVDPTRGRADLRARRLRPAGPGVLADDPLRVLRAVRLEATLGLRLTPAAARAVRAAAPGLTRVAAERVSDELVALLALPATGRALRRSDRLGVLEVVLPEVAPMRRAPQPAPHRFGVLEHSLRAVDASDRLLGQLDALEPFGEELAAHVGERLGGTLDRGRVLKLAALLHDVSKPETRRVVRGRVHFYEHDVIGARRARAIGERLRLPERAIAVLERLVRHHLRPMHLGQAGQVTRRARYRFYRDLGPDTRDLLLLSLVDAAAVTGTTPLQIWRRAPLVRDLMNGWAEAESVRTAPPLLRGEDVMGRFALAPGPAVGQLLARAREAQDLGLVRTRDEALAYLDSLDGGP
ncbi:MAG TPA: HD domain-containing protein [Patescibacteria group bacterium]|nr:HD domain-containing protein [Patescibacteria group bacterium]